jgi:hypothetical protein
MKLIILVLGYLILGTFSLGVNGIAGMLRKYHHQAVERFSASGRKMRTL